MTNSAKLGQSLPDLRLGDVVIMEKPRTHIRAAVRTLIEATAGVCCSSRWTTIGPSQPVSERGIP